MEWTALLLTLLLALLPTGATSYDLEDYWAALEPPEIGIEVIAYTEEPADPVDAPAVYAEETTDATEEPVDIPDEPVDDIGEPVEPTDNLILEQKGGAEAPASAADTYAYATDAAIAWAEEFALLWRNEEHVFSYEVMEINLEYSYPTLVWSMVGDAITLDFYLSVPSDEYWCLIDIDMDVVPLRQVDAYLELFGTVAATAYAAYREDATMGQFSELASLVTDTAGYLLDGTMQDTGDDDAFYYHDVFIDVDYDAYWPTLSCYLGY